MARLLIWRKAPRSMQASAWLVISYTAVSLAVIAFGVLAHVVNGTDLFGNSPGSSDSSLRTTMVAGLTVIVVGFIWGVLPLLFVPLLTRGSRSARWAISIFAVLNLLDSLTIPFDWVVWVPAAILSFGALLLWVPASSHYLRLRRDQLNVEKLNRGPSPFTRLR